MSQSPAPLPKAHINLLENVFAAIEADDVKQADAALSALHSEAGAEAAISLYAAGLHAWAAGDMEEAGAKLMAAVDEGLAYPQAYLDTAEFMLTWGHPIEEAEAPLRVLIEWDDLDAENRDDALLMLAQVRLEDDDPQEALEIAESVYSKEGQAYFGVRASIAIAGGDAKSGAKFMAQAVEADPEDADAHYHLGIALALAGEQEQSAQVMLRVLEFDAKDDDLEPCDDVEARALIQAFEEVLENLPEDLMKRVAVAKVSVQDRPTAEQVRAGVDPRGGVALLGKAAPADGGPEDAKLEGVTINRGPLFEEIAHEEDVHEVMLSHLLVEFRRFFAMDKLAVVAV